MTTETVTAKPNLFIVRDESYAFFELQADSRAPAVGAWIRHVFRKWFLDSGTMRGVETRARMSLSGVYRELTVSNAGEKDSIRFRDLTDDMLKALKNDATLCVVLAPGGWIRARTTHMFDFLTYYHEKHPDKDLSRISVPQCMHMVSEWDKEILRQKELEAIKAGSYCLFTSDEGSLWLISSKEALKREGERLGNCLKNLTEHYLKGQSVIVVVRDDKDASIAAGEFNFKMHAIDGKLVMLVEKEQFSGPRNDEPSEKAVKLLNSAAAKLDWRTLDDPTCAYVHDYEPDEPDEEEETKEIDPYTVQQAAPQVTGRLVRRAQEAAARRRAVVQNVIQPQDSIQRDEMPDWYVDWGENEIEDEAKPARPYRYMITTVPKEEHRG